jgi:aerobic carbon-monoxide dehydrogenase medium subunit
MKPPVFEYHRAGSAEEAVGLLAALGEDAKLLAGGQSLVPMMNFRLARPTALVDISRIGDLRFLRREDGDLVVGALARHRDFEHAADPQVLDGFSVLPRAARQIGHYVIRQSGTFGGSIAHADPAAEWCMVALLLDAQIGVLGPGGRRVVAADQFFRGFLDTDLSSDEMVVDIRLSGAFPRVGFQEFARRHGDFAVVAAAAALSLDGSGVRDARVVLGGVGGSAVRSTEAEAVLRGGEAGPATFAAAAQAAAAGINPPADLQGTPEYRRHLAAVLVRRALEEAVADGR